MTLGSFSERSNIPRFIPRVPIHLTVQGLLITPNWQFFVILLLFDTMLVVQSSPAGGSNRASDMVDEAEGFDGNLLDEFFGGQLVDDLQEQEAEPDHQARHRVSNRLLWTSVGVYNGPEGHTDALSALKIHAGPAWFESKARKERTLQTNGIPLSQTPRTRVGDGAVISEYKCPFAQVHHPPNNHASEHPCVRLLLSIVA